MQGLLGPESPQATSCCVAYLGGCTVAGGAWDGARVGQSRELAYESQFHLAVQLRRRFPGQPFVIRNFAEDGVTASQFLDRGRLEAMREVLPRVDVAFLRYGIADRKHEGIPKTIHSIESLCARLAATFQGITLVLETDMWVDYPAHYLWDRNPRLAPLYEELRQLAAAKRYPLVDIYSKVEAETASGNWDLRKRATLGPDHVINDASLDSVFGDDPTFFTEVHPNSHCLRLIAEWEVEELEELFGDRLPNSRGGTTPGSG